MATGPQGTAVTAAVGPLSEEDKARVRQQERTVDNLNRLFAMLFAIVFSLAASYLSLKRP